MRWTHTLIPTLKETPGDSDLVSHRLLLRAGLARKVASGLFALLPLGQRVLEKIVGLVRAELCRACALEISVPTLQPFDLERQTGSCRTGDARFFEIEDREDRRWSLGCAFGEAIASALAAEIGSYRHLPKNFYQVRLEFRDELRPRFGLMQGRELLVADGCSFAASDATATAICRTMHGAFERVFQQCGLRPLAAESGGGAAENRFAEEFMVPVEGGDDEVVYCDSGQYLATREVASSRGPVVPTEQAGTGPIPEEFLTPGVVTIEGLAKAPYGVPPERQIKTLVYQAGGRTILVLVRGDDQLSDAKLAVAAGTDRLRPAAVEEVVAALGAHPGSLGAVGVTHIPVYADHALRGAAGMTTGANKDGFHLRHVDLGRDIEVTQWSELRTVKPGELCVATGRPLKTRSAFGVGRIVKLGTGGGEPAGAFFLDQSGQRQPCVIGYYRLEIARVLQAVIEQANDRDGIVWPLAVAPYQVLITPLGVAPGSPAMTAAEALYRELTDHGLEVLLDDRDERPGVKFKDADLIGIPFRVGLGEKSLARGEVEIKPRAGSLKAVKVAAAAACLLEMIAAERRQTASG